MILSGVNAEMAFNSGFLTEKTGPLPNWAWAGGVLVAAIGWKYYQSKKNAAAAPATTATSTTAPITTTPTVPGNTGAPTVFALSTSPGSSSPPFIGRSPSTTTSPPSQPVGGLHVYAATSTGNSVTLVWTAVAGATSYNVTLTNATSGATDAYTVDGSSLSAGQTTTYQLAMTPGIPYTVTVTPVNSGGSGPPTTISASR